MTLDKVIITINGKTIGLIPSEIVEMKKVLESIEKADPAKTPSNEPLKLSDYSTVTFVTKT